MNCLNQLQTLCWLIFAKLDRPPRQVKQDELTTHFIFARDQVDPLKKVVKSGAFLPPKDKKLSVYRIHACSEPKIWWFGHWYVTKRRPDKKVVVARGDLMALIFSRQNLQIRPDGNPHPRHANIEGWPDDKPSQKMKAVELANNAQLVMKPVVAGTPLV